MIHFNNPNYHRWEVDQTLDVVALPITSEGITGWQLLGIFGLSGYPAAATENVSYDSVMALYRF